MFQGLLRENKSETRYLEIVLGKSAATKLLVLLKVEGTALFTYLQLIINFRIVGRYGQATEATSRPMR
jgi:hypothetical protein